jgi:hypothetical protein
MRWEWLPADLLPRAITPRVADASKRGDAFIRPQLPSCSTRRSIGSEPDYRQAARGSSRRSRGTPQLERLLRYDGSANHFTAAVCHRRMWRRRSPSLRSTHLLRCLRQAFDSDAAELIAREDEFERAPCPPPLSGRRVSQWPYRPRLRHLPKPGKSGLFAFLDRASFVGRPKQASILSRATNKKTAPRAVSFAAVREIRLRKVLKPARAGDTP